MARGREGRGGRRCRPARSTPAAGTPPRSQAAAARGRRRVAAGRAGDRGPSGGSGEARGRCTATPGDGPSLGRHAERPAGPLAEGPTSPLAENADAFRSGRVCLPGGDPQPAELRSPASAPPIEAPRSPPIVWPRPSSGQRAASRTSRSSTRTGHSPGPGIRPARRARTSSRSPARTPAGAPIHAWGRERGVRAALTSL